MNAVIKEQWVNALRSGKYAQCVNALHVSCVPDRASGHDKFCCLGVLAYILGYDWKSYDWSNPPRIKELIKGSNVTIPVQRKLAQMNDSGATFTEIADYISTNL